MTPLDSALLRYVEHPLFVLAPDAQGIPRYTGFSDYACRVLGKPLSEIIGRTAAEVYPSRMGQIAFEHHVEALKSGETAVYEIQLPLAGERRFVRTTLQPQKDDEGRVIALFGSSTEIAGTQVFQDLQVEIETMTQDVENFINLAAHDLRTPMRNVAQVAEMLREDFQDMGDGKVELIDVLEDVAHRSMQLIGDVLSYAQVAAIAQRETEFDFAELVGEVWAVLDPLKTCAISSGSGAVMGDPIATQLILRNLMDNALKFSKLGPAHTAGCQLALSVELRDLESGFVEFAVRDNGVGFNDLALLFLGGGKFRTDSGFGLLGIRRIIHARGGTLKVANRKSTSGAVVSFTLPGRILSAPGQLPRVA